jgi:inorganic pyrophosphatase
MPGDNDPLDAIELGSHLCRLGEVRAAVVLGSFEVFDQGEVDHKARTAQRRIAQLPHTEAGTSCCVACSSPPCSLIARCAVRRCC